MSYSILDLTSSDLKEHLIRTVADSGGIKRTDLLGELYSEFVYNDADNTVFDQVVNAKIDDLIRTNEIVEYCYVLPLLLKTVVSFLVPAGVHLERTQ